MADALLMSCRGLLRRLEVEAGRNEPRGLFCNGPRWLSCTRSSQLGVSNFSSTTSKC